MTDKEHIENVIRRTFDIIKNVYNYQQEKESRKNDKSQSRILFPKKSDKTTRVSEQELRFVFVEQLNKEIGEDGKYWDVYYSVETPTIEKYYFKEDPPKRDDNGQSANFDLVIHDSNYNRVALIEFKANNPDIHDYQKDFVKLSNEQEDVELRYFIQLLENTRKGKDEKIDTKKNIESKISPIDSQWKDEWGSKKVIVYCVSLEKREENIVVIDFQEYQKNC